MSQTRSRPLILLVEDDASMMLLLREVCQMQNYQAREAVTGRAALELALSDRPDLILLDWELPDISGLEVCQKLRRSGVVVPILMLTGRGDDRDVVTGLQQGIDEYLIKPVRPRVLAARLAANLRRASAATERVNDNTSEQLLLLDRVSIFLSHPPGALRALAKKAVTVSVQAGSVVLAKGAPNYSLLLIQSGSFEVAIERSRENTFAVALLGEADFFGAVSVLTGEPAAATVTAREDSTLVKISRDDLLAALVPGSEARAQLESVVEQRRALLKDIHSRSTIAAGDAARFVSLYSPRGGVGKTTLALNLAASLARDHRAEVVLVDLSLPYNHAALLARLAPSTSLARLADIGTDFDERLLSALVHHPAGFLLLSTALTPEEADLVTPALLDQALAVLKAQFGYLVFDLGVGLSEVALSVLEQSRVVFVVATPELLIVKDLTQLYGIFHGVLKLAAGHVHLVVNHRASTATVGRREMEKLLGVEIAVEIRHDGRRPEEAALKGDILALSASRSPIAKAAAAFTRLVEEPRSRP